MAKYYLSFSIFKYSEHIYLRYNVSIQAGGGITTLQYVKAKESNSGCNGPLLCNRKFHSISIKSVVIIIAVVVIVVCTQK